MLGAGVLLQWPRESHCQSGPPAGPDTSSGGQMGPMEGGLRKEADPDSQCSDASDKVLNLSGPRLYMEGNNSHLPGCKGGLLPPGTLRLSRLLLLAPPSPLPGRTGQH